MTIRTSYPGFDLPTELGSGFPLAARKKRPDFPSRSHTGSSALGHGFEEDDARAQRGIWEMAGEKEAVRWSSLITRTTSSLSAFAQSIEDKRLAMGWLLAVSCMPARISRAARRGKRSGRGRTDLVGDSVTCGAQIHRVRGYPRGEPVRPVARIDTTKSAC